MSLVLVSNICLVFNLQYCHYLFCIQGYGFSVGHLLELLLEIR